MANEGYAVIDMESSDVFEVNYHDDNGVKFFTEIYEQVPLEYVDSMVDKWKNGERELS